MERALAHLCWLSVFSIRQIHIEKTIKMEMVRLISCLLIIYLFIMKIVQKYTMELKKQKICKCVLNITLLESI